MFLLRLRNRGYDRVFIMKDHEAAKTKGRDFVGVHNPSDGCSTVPREQHYTGGRWSIQRSTSFGSPSAWLYTMQSGPGDDPMWDIT